jgi:hypothetical protein
MEKEEPEKKSGSGFWQSSFSCAAKVKFAFYLCMNSD